MKLTRYEQEVVINFNADEDMATVYSANPVWIRKMDSLVREFPGVFRVKRFGVHFAGSLCCRSCPVLGGVSLSLVRCCGQGSSVSLPEVVALHRRGAYPIQAGHSIGIIHR